MEEEKPPPIKRYRKEEPEDSDKEDWDTGEDDFKPYIPVKERRKQTLVKLGRLAAIQVLILKVIRGCMKHVLIFICKLRIAAEYNEALLYRKKKSKL